MNGDTAEIYGLFDCDIQTKIDSFLNMGKGKPVDCSIRKELLKYLIKQVNPGYGDDKPKHPYDYLVENRLLDSEKVKRISLSQVMGRMGLPFIAGSIERGYHLRDKYLDERNDILNYISKYECNKAID